MCFPFPEDTHTMFNYTNIVELAVKGRKKRNDILSNFSSNHQIKLVTSSPSFFFLVLYLLWLHITIAFSPFRTQKGFCKWDCYTMPVTSHWTHTLLFWTAKRPSKPKTSSGDLCRYANIFGRHAFYTIIARCFCEISYVAGCTSFSELYAANPGHWYEIELA